jgi:type IV pilus assembly protein PilX
MIAMRAMHDALHTHRRAGHAVGRRSAQRGVSLLFALLALVAMTLATLAMVRSVDTSSLLIGNIGLKQDATAAADQATQQAINWLTLNSATLNADIPSSGYYASSQDYAADGVTLQSPLDVTGQQLTGTANRQLIDWDGNSCQSAPSGSYAACTLLSADSGTVNNNATRYAIFRLCSKTGDYTVDTSINCIQPLSGSGTSAAKRGLLNYSDPARFTSAGGPYYRVVVRVQGTRNTASYTETIVHF